MIRVALAFIFAAVAQVPAAFADSADFKFSIDTSSRYTLQGDVATAQDSTGVVTIEIKSVVNGREESFVLGPVEATEPLQETVTISDDRVHVRNEKERYDMTLRASVNRHFLTGKLRSFVVPKEDVMRAMSASLAKQGQQLLSRLSVMSEGASVEFKVETSDLVCAADDGDRLSCNLSAQILLKAKN